MQDIVFVHSRYPTMKVITQPLVENKERGRQATGKSYLFKMFDLPSAERKLPFGRGYLRVTVGKDDKIIDYLRNHPDHVNNGGKWLSEEEELKPVAIPAVSVPLRSSAVTSENVGPQVPQEIKSKVRGDEIPVPKRGRGRK